MANPSLAITTEELAGVLQDAVQSLTALDAERLEQLERELSLQLASHGNSLFADREARKDDALRAVMATHRLLGSLLESTAMNLMVLERLRRRNNKGDGQWAR